MKNGPYELLVAPKDYPGKKYRSRYAYEHHVVFWKKHGFVPKKGYEIHHKNGNHRDNRITNLKLVTGEEHRKLHGALSTKKAIIKFNCGFCSKEVEIISSRYRSRLKQRKFGKLFCSISCGAKHQFKDVGCRSR